ncbi:MAG: hypothetical protein R3C49_17825 [Planctomycetaceae bacterium]
MTVQPGDWAVVAGAIIATGLWNPDRIHHSHGRPQRAAESEVKDQIGHRVFLTAADPEVQQQQVLCFDRDSGQQIWKTVVHEGGFPDPKNKQESGNEKAGVVVDCL